MDVDAPQVTSLVNGLMSVIAMLASRELRAMLVAIMVPGCREHAVIPSSPYLRWSSDANSTLHSFAWP